MSRGIVLDCSAVMGFCFEDEATSFHNKLLDRLDTEGGIAPEIWLLEIGNSLIMGEKRKRITPTDSDHFLRLLAGLSVNFVCLSNLEKLPAVMALAKSQNLSFYDAQYLYLAFELRVPLATLDKSLQIAAQKVGVALV